MPNAKGVESAATPNGLRKCIRLPKSRGIGSRASATEERIAVHFLFCLIRRVKKLSAQSSEANVCVQTV